MPMAVLQNVALYILEKVKQRVDTCGGYSGLVSLYRNGDLDVSEIAQAEGGFEQIDSEITQLVVERISKNRLIPNLLKMQRIRSD